MLQKLPRNKADLSPDLLAKINKLSDEKIREWDDKFKNLNSDKTLYDILIKKINDNSLDNCDINDTITNKKDLERSIPRQENELLKPFEVNVDLTLSEITRHKAKHIYRNGATPIRSEFKGKYSPVKLRQVTGVEPKTLYNN